MTLDAPEREIGKPAFTVLSDAVSGLEVPGVQVELGGDAVVPQRRGRDSATSGSGFSSRCSCCWSCSAPSWPPSCRSGSSIVAVGAGIGAITLLAGTMDVSVSAIAVAGLVGLGVGVDYALFIVARYRENRVAGQDNTRALGNAMGSSGAAVVFAGGTVIVATACAGHHGTRRPHLDRPVHRPDGAERCRGGGHPAPGTPQPAR